MANWLQKQWVAYSLWYLLLIPLSWLFGGITFLRKLLYKIAFLKSVRLPVPVIVVGNINVGGTGKTPLVIWLAEQLQLAGYTPGVISRGYGGNSKEVQAVFANSNPAQVGDEPVLIAKRIRCPVFIGANRIEAAEALLLRHPECNVIISDDGLQHYRLQRDVEIVVFDGVKGFGNGALLPAGPLRESKVRLKTVDAIVSNGEVTNSHAGLKADNLKVIQMNLQSGRFYNLLDNQQQSDASAFSNQKVLAIAGIGNPERFFQQLRKLGLSFDAHSYADHHAFQWQDFESVAADIVLMTEKDAVKCQAFAQSNFWVLPVHAVINNDLIAIVLNKLNMRK
ncbi:MAG: tetraacyldisaccharide 4'-kinase [Bacteroidia bacterium]|nr:tetraacyldisaccharide 4'-kinase [Methylotenera sp.]